MGNGESSSSKYDDELDFPDDVKSDSVRHGTGDQISAELCQLLVTNSKKHDVGDDISRQSFVEHFHSEKVPDAGGLLYVRFSGGRDGAEPPPSIGRDTLAKFCTEVRNLIVNSHQQRYYLLLFSNGKPTIEKDAVENFFRTCFLLESEIVGSKYDCDPSSPLLTSIPQSLAQACVRNETAIAIDSLQTWIAQNCPNVIHSSIHRWVIQHLLPNKPMFKSYSNGGIDHKPCRSVSGTNGHHDDHHADDDDSLLHPMLAWLFSNTMPKLYVTPRRPKMQSPLRPTGCSIFYDPREILNSLFKCNGGFAWSRLYSNAEHGESMNRFQHHVFSYRGPTAMLVRTDADVTLCVGIDHEWREHNSRWGGDHCIVVQITPSFKIFEVGDKMMYFNLTARGYPFGLHVGRNPKSPVLEIDPDFCVAAIKKIPYKLETLEVWGCAEEETLDAQIKQKKWETDQAEKQKKVNLNAVDWTDNPDRYLLELAGKPSYSSTFKR